ncbi:MAG TPA: SDR family oxidoreductase [Chitinophagaceae bacterium]|nr:SDR family oxidoreductase [Chitinophagaceae bacterium]MCC6634204.1 SDR family oxidoreductase [Chitinophagaceae bacterium]HMZ46240.1 SDR family oxidoreductase [Chitinophagaceae bacterium]HNE93973.1 SDR family oxidoreductase [Chitinophagaceae bacterium]HNF29794.1 SDR family oxidoreductase [Chitinophagaceae bacterium]
MNIIITGASKGLGKAFAKIFAAQNHTLLLCARNQQQLTETATEIKEEFPLATIHYTTKDLSKKNDAIEFGNWCLQFGKPSILINNAGQFIPGSIYNEEDGILEKMIEINLYSAYHLTRAILPSMIKNKEGHIFNICSIASLKAYTNGGSYSISKYALMGFSKNLREELKPFQVKVTTVYPGAVYTDSWSNTGVEENRIMEPNDIAKMVYSASLLSPQACVEDIVLRPQLGDI